jgi:glycosyltransferase involved in cell wall biosynthesis
MSKHLLFIISDFYPGGSQRQTYELDVILKKMGIQTSILCMSDLNESEHFTDHYYKLHLELGTPIQFLSKILPKEKSKLQRVVNKISNTKNQFKLNEYLKQFDDTWFFGEYTFKKLQYLFDFPKDHAIKLIIVCSRFQGKQYREFNKKNKYIFIDGFNDENQVKWEFEGFEDYTHVMLPLSLIPTEQYRKWKFQNTEKKKIGIFTRLSKAKPLDPFFYTFSILQEQFPTLELHIFGSGTPEQAEYDRYIRHLDLKNVHFRGHQENLKASINNEELDLVWFQGYLNRPAGYAGFDVALTGTPQLFWDFYEGENPLINDSTSVYPHFKKIVPFCEASKSVLFDKSFAERLSVDQFNETVANRDMSKNIELLKEVIN